MTQLATQKRKIGRPNNTSKEEILKAAIELLSEGGESALSFRKLGSKIGVTAPSIYSYFPDKLALLKELADQMFDISFINHECTEGTPRDRLELLIQKTYASLSDKSHLMFIFSSAMPSQKILVLIDAYAQPIREAGFEEPEAIRQAQSLIWMVLSFSLFETHSQEATVTSEILEVDQAYHGMLEHLDISSHERLWALTLKRNLDGIFEI